LAGVWLDGGVWFGYGRVEKSRLSGQHFSGVLHCVPWAYALELVGSIYMHYRWSSGSKTLVGVDLEALARAQFIIIIIITVVCSPR
jgi:hypothetical protein